MLTAALSGFLLGATLIIAIGAQNAYVLRMGLLGHHVFLISLFCAVSDALLIAMGVAGMGAMVKASPALMNFLALFGGGFLLAYAAIAARRALRPQAMVLKAGERPPLAAALATVAGFTWLNPHVYLDTVVLIGAFSAQYETAGRLAYALGAIVASFAWFFSLGYGARLLVPFFARRQAWQILDAAIALIMAALGMKLLWTLV